MNTKPLEIGLLCAMVADFVIALVLRSGLGIRGVFILGLIALLCGLSALVLQDIRHRNR